MARTKAKRKAKELPRVEEKSEYAKEDPLQEKSSAEPRRETGGKNTAAWIAALVFGAMVILALGYSYANVTQKNMLKQVCNEYSLSPDLKYPTVCVPFDDDSNSGDYVDKRSNPVCRCKVDLGNGTSTIIDIRVAN